MNNSPIGVFDSGIGGKNVLFCCRQIMPNEKFIYLADTANMPYGNKIDSQIIVAATACAERLFDMDCKAVLIACNTATAVAIDCIRARFPQKITVGLEPAVKPCLLELGASSHAVALVTRATKSSAKFKRLIATSGGKVIPLCAPLLAEMIERGESEQRLTDYIYDLLMPYADAEAVILGCSHYSAITGIIKKFYGDGIKIYDGAEGAAQRLRYCLALRGWLTDSTTPQDVEYIST